MNILIVLSETEIQSRPSAYLKIIRYLKGKFPTLIVKITQRCGHSGSGVLKNRLTHGFSTDSASSDSSYDLIIVSNSHRLPDFDLFESAYAEYLFLDKPVLNCSVSYLENQILSVSQRERRFGK